MIAFYLREPVISDSEIITVVEDRAAALKILTSALLASGFRQKDDLAFIPCPLGTFTDPSTKGENECKECPPGNF